MNKLLLVEDRKLTNDTYEITYNKDLKLDIKGKVSLNNYDNLNNSLELNLEDKSILNFDKVNILNKDTHLVINVLNDDIVNLNWIIINSGQNKVHLTLNMKGNNSKVEAHVRIINKNDNDNVDLICDGNIDKETIDNILVEDLKGLITKKDTIKISPNMKVLTNEVIANHLVTIGSFEKQELFYLESLGLSKKEAEKLIKISFITSLTSYKELIKMEVITNE
ncbi:MAG: SufD family Fe-S cluster assembly protein [Ruminococcus sp.]|nr:SufD family Fe-S cluster assembly protein [Ruminococcus sp.]